MNVKWPVKPQLTQYAGMTIRPLAVDLTTEEAAILATEMAGDDRGLAQFPFEITCNGVPLVEAKSEPVDDIPWPPAEKQERKRGRPRGK